MSGAIEFGRCDICGQEAELQRKYYQYDVPCECHSPNHFEKVSYCKNCIPVEPKETKITISTKKLKELSALRAQLETEINQHGLDNLQLVEERNEARTERNEYKAKLEAAEKENLSLRTSRNGQRQNNKNLKNGIKYWQNRCAKVMDECTINKVISEEQARKIKLFESIVNKTADKLTQQDATIAQMRGALEKIANDGESMHTRMFAKQALAFAPTTRLELLNSIYKEAAKVCYDMAMGQPVVLMPLNNTVCKYQDALKWEGE